jgi:peptidoglycan/xylan/chitin deacetylase (PgdA/CDA1 family)
MSRVRRLCERLAFTLKTKGVVGFILRIGMLIRRFDFSGNKMKASVHQIKQLGKKYKYRPAMIVPGIVLKRHHRLLNHSSHIDLEFAIHGYTHRNFKPLGLDEQISEIRRAKDVFEQLQIPAYGFRAPYLSWNGHTGQAVQSNDLLWESDEAFMWNGFEKPGLFKLRHSMEKGIDVLYNPLDGRKSVVIPRLQGNIVRIPIALPDDEILIDRLGIRDSNRIGQLWSEILESTHQCGHIFVLQLHPERFGICGEVMEKLLDKALNSKGDVWVTGMREVAQWWKQKSQFKFSFQAVGQTEYRVYCKCTDRATILARNVDCPDLQAPFYRDYRRISGREFVVKSEGLKPCIGVHSQCSQELLKFLSDEGFPYEVSDNSAGYSLFLKDYEIFGRENELDLLRRIEESPNPIVRYWLWPDGKKSAFATSHDLDCVTLTDFVFRLLGR